MYRFRTDDPAAFVEHMRGIAPGLAARALQGRAFSTRTEAVPLPRSALFSVTSRNLRVRVDHPVGYLGLTVPMAGEFQAAGAGPLRTYAADTAHILKPEMEFEFRSPRTSTVLVANLFKPLVDRAVARMNGEGDGPRDTIQQSLPLDSSGGATLRRYLNFLWREAQTDSAAIRSRLVAEEFEGGLLSALVFAADEARGGVLSPPMDHCSSTYVRRAEDFLAASIEEPVMLADVSAAAGVPIRTLTRGFRNKHGVGPIGYLRRLRLDQAFRDLLAADPAKATVTEIAFKYGFYSLGRFSDAYRRAFDESPSATLRR